MNLSDNFKKFMGMVEQNAQQLKKDLTWTPLPSGPEVWEQGKKNGEKMKEEILKNRGAEMATDLLPAGGAVSMVKKVLGETEDWAVKSNWFFPKTKEHTVDRIKELEEDLKKVNAKKVAFKMESATLDIKDPVFKEKRDKRWMDIFNEESKKLENRKALLKEHLQKLNPTDEFFGMHKSTDLGDVVLTKSAKDPSKFQMTFFEGKLGSSNTVKDEQFDTMEEAVKAFRETQ